jgi:hypothetical protein
VKYLAIVLPFLCAAWAGSPDRPRVSPDLISSMAQTMDRQMASLTPDDPVMPVGVTQGAYINGYGAVFMGSLNLAPMAGITPFHQSISKQELQRVHQKKADRLPKLKQMMQELLANLAAGMDPVPANDQIAVVVSLFYFTGENTSGLPAQVVMHAQKKALVEGRGKPAMLASAVQVDEY